MLVNTGVKVQCGNNPSANTLKTTRERPGNLRLLACRRMESTIILQYSLYTPVSTR